MKTNLIRAFCLTSILLGGCIWNIPSMILIAVCVICALLVFLNIRDATFLLFFFSPLSYILVYNEFSLYIFIALAYIAAVLTKYKNYRGLVPAFFLISYCVIFANFDVSIKIGQLIYPILLLLLYFTCQFIAPKDYKNVMAYFTIGFITSAVIGLFKDQIPLLQSFFSTDTLFIDGVETSMDIQRFSGLSYDPNFFTLVDCIIISMLLFSGKQLTMLKGLALLFLIIIGFFTFSKSYVILLMVILVSYVLKYSKKPIKNMIILAVCFLCLLVVENFTSINVLSLIQARFSSAENTNDLTTGRADLWIDYLDYILSNPKCLVFGEGFNALSLDKAVHNTYLDFLYRFGILGTCLWIIYILSCKKMVDPTVNGKTHPNIVGIVFLSGIFFLSAFHFHQLWCCLYFAMIAPYINREYNQPTPHL